MTRWNILEIAFYGVEGRRRAINFVPDAVNIITGASGTGKSAVIDAINYCLGSSNCGLPFYVREHAIAVAVRWGLGDSHLVVGRNIPRAGKGTEQMFVKMGRNLSLPRLADRLEGPTSRATARGIVERAFGIGRIHGGESPDDSEDGQPTVRDITPYIFLSGDIIISKTNLFYDLNRPEKAREIKATIPFFLGAVDQESVLLERRLRRLEAMLGRLERDAQARDRSRTRAAERSISLLSQAAAVGLTGALPSVFSAERLLQLLRNIRDADITRSKAPDGDDLASLEEERLELVRELQEQRERRRALRQAIKEASGYGTAVSGQSRKLDLVRHLKLDSGKCPICDAENLAGRKIAEQIRASLEIIGSEVVAVDRLRPELISESARLDERITFGTGRLREVETQISAIIRQTEDAERTASLMQERALIVGRVHQFLDMTMQDSDESPTNLESLRNEIGELRDRIDPEARRERLRDAENMIGNYATEILSGLPTEVPATDSRIVFSAAPKVVLIEPERRAALSLAEIGSDQNYLAIHLAIAFALQRHFEVVKAPVPGLLVIDQVSRPFYAEGGDEKDLEDMAKDSDRLAMRRIVRAIFEETSRRSGLQIILIEHAFIGDDPAYVGAIRERWTSKTNQKLIPSDWPARP
ncbi:DUF3732 domain-containing protein [Bradyrhizobium oligotrophicum]|uniref:DUF3732 domain-containing protein n=1 Tax=Bradyrhizobium oligotrophicum TaxID=44255 RepID=UPI003EB77C93